MLSDDAKVRVYIEIEQNSNMKYEICKETHTLVLDRILPPPYVYPFPYGYIVDTRAADGDDLDMVLLTDKPIANNTFLDVYIVGVLIMEDEQGMDEKVLCVLPEDADRITNLDDVPLRTRETIAWFFSNYKTHTPGKWSRVSEYRDKHYAIDLYTTSRVVLDTNNSI
jgi:inorganic pyrophosphatase